MGTQPCNLQRWEGTRNSVFNCWLSVPTFTRATSLDGRPCTWPAPSVTPEHALGSSPVGQCLLTGGTTIPAFVRSWHCRAPTLLPGWATRPFSGGPSAPRPWPVSMGHRPLNAGEPWLILAGRGETPSQPRLGRQGVATNILCSASQARRPCFNLLSIRWQSNALTRRARRLAGSTDMQPHPRKAFAALLCAAAKPGAGATWRCTRISIHGRSIWPVGTGRN